MEILQVKQGESGIEEDGNIMEILQVKKGESGIEEDGNITGIEKKIF